MNKKRAYIFILAAAALWGCIAVFFKMMSAAGLTSMQSVAVRVTLAAVIYVIFLAIKKPGCFKIKLRHVPLFLGTGIVSLIFFNLCYFNCISQSSMAVAAVLLYTAPIFVTLLSAAIFKDRITGRVIAALCITFFGCVLVTGVLSGGGARLSGSAILLGLGSGIGYALYTIFGKLALKHYCSETVTVYTFIFGAAASIPMARFGQMSGVIFSGRLVFASLGIALICCVLPYILYTKGLESVAPGRASIMATLEPVVAALISAIFYHESFTFMKIAGLVLVVGAIVLLNLGGGKKEASPAILGRDEKKVE